MTEADSNSNPLQTIIEEFKNFSPQLASAFIYKDNGETIAASKDTSQENIKCLFNNFNNINQLAKDIEQMEVLTIRGKKGQLAITAINNYFLATVSEGEANQKIVKSLTQVIVPTVIKLLDNAPVAISSSPQSLISQEEEVQAKPTIIGDEKVEILSTPEVPTQIEPLPPLPPVNQLMVEKIGGLLVVPDTVRIDNDVLAKWNDLYEGKGIAMVSIETLDGKKITCRFKPMNDTKYAGKGLIQMPDRILHLLQTCRGKLVMVKPVVK